MYDELIEELRRHHCDAKEDDTQEICEECAYDVIIADKNALSGFASVCVCGLMHRASDAIEELRKEVLRLEDESGLYDELPTFYIYSTKWIPVTERLPENRQRCLVYTTTYRIGYFAKNLEKVDKYDFRGEKHHGWYYLDSEWGFCEILNVTHWMPLPEPPKEG